MSADRHDDQELVALAQRGDLDAFETLVRDHTREVYVHALRFFGDEHAAEDVAQEVFIKVYRSLKSFDGTAAFSTWLYRVTRNTCLDAMRSGKRRPAPIDPVDAALQSAPGDLADAVAVSVALESGMRALPPEDRDALQAVTLFGLSYAEAGKALGVPAGTVKSRVFRARRALIASLGIETGGER
jgi:RNA polymerase sigma-70 factor (ECF subfamily)